ncbi:hypothetical protein ABIB00_003934 [Bradyrhizobium sp. LB14.3]
MPATRIRKQWAVATSPLANPASGHTTRFPTTPPFAANARSRPDGERKSATESFLTKRDARLSQIAAGMMQSGPRIVESEDGGPLRLIINGRHIKPTGRYPAFKADGASLPYEAEHEVGLMEISDADKAVISILAQPHRVEIPVPWQNRPLIYFPDLRRDLADGTVEIIETKREDDRRAKDPHYQFKLDVVREVYAGEDWTFRTLMEKQILGGRLYRNAHEISTWAYAKVPSTRQFALEGAIDAAGGTLPFGKAAEIVGGAPLLYALVVRRSVYFDLKLPVSDDLPVMRVDHDALRRHSPPLL